jgi:hypothetical protein
MRMGPISIDFQLKIDKILFQFIFVRNYIS